jgi:NADPH-dependent 2,4-dienoyl-CoA reductase/sulfur reductase-like enzyme
VQVVTGAVAVRLDPGGDVVPAAVHLADGTRLEAGAVVLAEGGRASRLPVPGDELALVLRTLDDARVLRERLRPGVRLVVLGGGLVGAEVAATAVGLGVHVTVVDPDPLPAAGAVGPEVARVLVEDHVRHGVRVVTAGATALQPTHAGVRVALSDGTAVEADVVLVAAGMRPADDLARSAGIEVAPGGGTVVDAQQRTSAGRVLAVGDGTCRRRPDGSPGRPPGHWDAARLDGLTAAAVLLGRQPPARGAPWFWSDRHHRHVEVVGDVGAGSRTVVRGEPGPGPFSVLGWRDGTVTGAVAVDDPLAARAARRLVDRGVPVGLDVLQDPATDLRRLARG